MSLYCGSPGGKVNSDISLGDGAEKCIAQRMQQNIGIRVAEQAEWMFDSFTAEEERAPFGEAMDIITATDSNHGVQLKELQCGWEWKLWASLTLGPSPLTGRGKKTYLIVGSTSVEHRSLCRQL